MKLLGVLLGASLSLAQQPAASPGPPVPYEDAGACPFEGCVYRTWTANRAVVVRTQRRAEAPVAFRLAKGARVQALTGVVVTHKAGRVEFPTAVELSATPEAVQIEAGERLYLLTYKGEGLLESLVQWSPLRDLDGSTFIGGGCNTLSGRCRGTIVEQPTRTWWVQVEDAGRPIGWSSEPEAFDGKDALGG